ncbi:hypothetical protein KEM56_000175 [Ascosphaera pollenicola]|nr:hypothetical protein KEM56_000175 [Ascosphaera pollenicola]
MDEQIERLVQKTWNKFQSLAPTHRLMIAVAGIPGSGKTSLARILAERINAIYKETNPDPTLPTLSPIAESVSMDGYHLYRHELAAMPDPVYAADRRGAAFTFNAGRFLALVKELRQPLTGESKTIYAPSFDHAKKDPVEDDVPIPPTARVLFFEGNYLALNKHPWTECAKLMDELWFVEVDFEVARHRLIRRHLDAGLAPTWELADQRARENDLVNGQEIVDNMLHVDEVIKSTEDSSWGPPAA